MDDVTKISSRDRNLHRAAEQILVDTVEVDKVVLPVRVSERISERSEVIKLTEISSQDGICSVRRSRCSSVYDRHLQATKKVDEHRDQNLQRAGDQSLVDSAHDRYLKAEALFRGRLSTKGGQFKRLRSFNALISNHRRTSTGNALLLVRRHVACVSKT